LQAKVFDHALDTARAELQAGLSDFLSNNLSRSVRVKEAMPNDLTCNLLGAAVVVFWSPFFARESLGAMKAKGLANLVVPRLAEAECLSSLAWTEGTTFALDQHSKLSSDVVICGDAKGSMRSNEYLSITIKRKHKKLLKTHNTGEKQ
jgi:hypothetical protein